MTENIVRKSVQAIKAFEKESGYNCSIKEKSY